MSGARGGRRVNVVPDEPEVKAGTLRERLRPGAQKTPKKHKKTDICQICHIFFQYFLLSLHLLL